jgi:S-(hydroxymethyl)glutathione dehydrogenase/alcohol dehydrogenase
MVDVGGTATVIGIVADDARPEISAMDLLSGRRVQGSMMGSNQFRVDIPPMYADGRLDLDTMVLRTLTLDDVYKGYSLMKRGEVARSAIGFPP